MRPAAFLLMAALLPAALRADITVYPAGQVIAPSSELAPFAEASASGAAFLGSTEGPASALLNPGSLGFSGYPFLAFSGVGPFNTYTQFSDFELGFSQPLGDGALSLYVRDYKLGQYYLYDSQGASYASEGGLLASGNEYYSNLGLGWRFGAHLGLGAGLGDGYVSLPGVGSYARPWDLSLGTAWRCLDAADTVLSLALRQAPVTGSWLASTGSAVLGVESGLWRDQLRAAVDLENLFSVGWEGRAGLRWTLRDGGVSFLAGAVLKDPRGDPAQMGVEPSVGLNSQFTNLAGTLALSYGDGQSYQFTGELDWRFRPDAFSDATLRGPDASTSYMDAGSREQQQGHLPEALVLFSKATEADPGNAQAAQLLADTQKQIGTAQLESAHLREIRATAQYFSKLAEDYYAKGDLKRAADNLESALRVDDQDRAIFDRLTAIRAELGRKVQSLQAKAAMAEQADDVEAQATACESALALDPGQDWPQQTLARLAPAVAKLRNKLYLKAVDEYLAADSQGGSVGDKLQHINAAISLIERAMALSPSADEKSRLDSTLWKCGNLKRRLES
jgi:tetratricopeptide (TPR) repeat protein